MNAKLHPATARLGIIAIVLIIWEVAARRFGDPLFISPPSRVLAALVQLAHNKEIVSAVRLTCWELVAAFVLSVVIGLTLGLIVGLNRFTRGSMYPVILLLYAIPQATILPLFVLTFGIGTASKIAFGVSHGVFPIIMTVTAGVQNIEPILLTSARSMGAKTPANSDIGYFPAHGSELFQRLAARDDCRSVRRAAGGTLRLAVRRGTFHYRIHANLPAAEFVCAVAVLAAIAVTLNELCRWAESRFSRLARVNPCVAELF